VASGPGVDSGLRRRLGLVKVGVDALVADLESVDAVEEEVRPLRDLTAGLVLVGRPAVPAGVELERLRERALAVLRAFAAGDRPGGRPGQPSPEPGPGWAPEPAPAPDPAQGPGQGPSRDPAPEFWKR
jgi:hypothetical protein